jgi:photosystem II stability/assembly factor-like uncharacterized protein
MRGLVVLAALVACVTAASQWTVTNPEFATIAFDVSFIDTMNGMAPVDINGQGSFVWITKDGGKTWTPAPEMDPAALYIGGAMAAVYNAVVSEPLIVYASDETDHWNFTASLVEPSLTFTSQNVETFAGGMFGVTGGDPDAGEGVIISQDGGATFAFSKAPFTTMARYGAFPSATTWYLSGGEWPRRAHALAAGETIEHEVSSRVHYVRDVNGNLRTRFTDRSAEYLVAPEAGAWKAQIVKTSDGGANWQSVYYSEDQFYFNQISCGSESHCCAVGESDNGTAPGIRIWCTIDAGKTWTQNLYVNDPEHSILALQFISDTEAFAPAGNLDADNFQGIFYHTTDGGKTWDGSATLDNVFGNCISMLDSTHGFATAITVDQQSAFLTFGP